MQIDPAKIYTPLERTLIQTLTMVEERTQAAIRMLGQLSHDIAFGTSRHEIIRQSNLTILHLTRMLHGDTCDAVKEANKILSDEGKNK